MVHYQYCFSLSSLGVFFTWPSLSATYAKKRGGCPNTTLPFWVPPNWYSYQWNISEYTLCILACCKKTNNMFIVHNLVNLVRTHMLYMCMYVCLYIVYISCIILCRYTFWACAATMRFPQLLGLELLCSSDLLLRTLQYRPHQLLLPRPWLRREAGALAALGGGVSGATASPEGNKGGKSPMENQVVFWQCVHQWHVLVYINAIYTPLHYPTLSWYINDLHVLN